jgi:hypothetical protein
MLERSKLLMVPATVTVPKFNWAMPTVTASGVLEAAAAELP